MLAIRREMDRSLAPYRRKMSAEQLAQLERQYIQKRLFEQFDLAAAEPVLPHVGCFTLRSTRPYVGHCSRLD